jgi:hypothetical protein
VRSNLENVAHSRNQFEREPYSSTGFYGVTKLRGKFQVQLSDIQPGKKTRSVYLGVFTTALEAAQTYDDAARRMYGPFVRCNFPLDE